MTKLKKVQSLKKYTLVCLSYVGTLVFFSPLITILIELFTPHTDNFYHIINTFLIEQTLTTIALMSVVSLSVLAIVFPVVSLLVLYEFPGRKFFNIALILPLAIPTYIGAYVYDKIFDYSGIINVLFREFMGINHALSFNLFSFSGGVFIFSLFLYPYLYTVLLSFFRKYIGEMIEVSRSLGHSIPHTLIKLILPFAKASIFTGLMMICMEILNDFGVTSYLGLQTFSASIFKAWFSLNDIKTASKLAGYLIPLIFILIYMIQFYNHQNNHHITPSREPSLIKLRGFKSFAAISYCSLLFFISFVLPIAVLTYYSIFSIQAYPIWPVLYATAGTIILCIFSTIILVILGILFASFTRKNNLNIYSNFFSLQYSLPSIIIAVSILITAITLESLHLFPKGFTTTLQNCFILLIFAYLMRFIILSYNTAHSAFKKIGTNYQEISQTLGHSKIETFFKIELPLMIPNLTIGGIIIFIDIFKELPLTLFLRPFNFETPATRAHDLVVNEMFTESAPSSLAIIIILTCVTFLMFKIGYFSDKKGDS